jgi:hypothetical protein
MIEEQHVSHYGALTDPKLTWLESMLLHDYAEAYLYYSFYREETHPAIKAIWENHLNMEIGHLHKAAELLKNMKAKTDQNYYPSVFQNRFICSPIKSMYANFRPSSPSRER